MIAAFAMLLAAGFLTACGGSEQHRATGSSAGKSSEASDHNAYDIAFARNMVPHHEQAVQMAQMVPTNTTNQQVIALANQLTTTEVSEMQAFRVWLMQWQDAQGSDSAGHDTHVPTAGMVDKPTMDKLQSLSGAAFDRLWLTTMIDHHSGSIAMAQGEVAHGRNADVLYLARSIIASQQAEIDRMKQMLGG
jgi:uncharacterized protein (DUF305 family)